MGSCLDTGRGLQGKWPCVYAHTCVSRPPAPVEPERFCWVSTSEGGQAGLGSHAGPSALSSLLAWQSLLGLHPSWQLLAHLGLPHFPHAFVTTGRFGHMLGGLGGHATAFSHGPWLPGWAWPHLCCPQFPVHTALVTMDRTPFASQAWGAPSTMPGTPHLIVTSSATSPLGLFAQKQGCTLPHLWTEDLGRREPGSEGRGSGPRVDGWGEDHGFQGILPSQA